MAVLIVTGTQLTTLSEAPAQSAEAITPEDGALIGPYRALWVGGGDALGDPGDLSVRLVADSAAVTFSNVPPGTHLPIAVKQVNATGTTATLIVGLK